MKLYFYVTLYALILSTAASAATCRDLAISKKGDLGGIHVMYPVRIGIVDGRPGGNPGLFPSAPPPLTQAIGIPRALYVAEGSADAGVDVRDVQGAALVIDSLIQIDNTAQGKVYAVRFSFVDQSLNQKYVGPGLFYGICQD